MVHPLAQTNKKKLTNNSHQLHAICTQRLFENQQRFLRNSHKSWEDKRAQEGKSQPPEPDETFWKTWTEAHGNYFSVCKSLKTGQSKLSEQTLREKFPKTWKEREYWGADMTTTTTAMESEFGSKYRLPLGMGSSVAEAVGFAQSVLKEFVDERGIKHSAIEL
jgi:hypothetical protein